jgi:DNA-binding NarL/FixJ family response regulator
VWESLQDQLYLGDSAFADALRQRKRTLTNPNEIPRIQRRAKAQPLAYFVALPVRNQAIAQAHATGCYSLKEIADAFGLHYATISRVVLAAEVG